MDHIRRLAIPTEFAALWRYLGRVLFDRFDGDEWLSDLGSAYALDAFVKSCPSDQEIVLHWIRRETSPKEYLQLTKEEPKYSLGVPESR